jgi:hypothetical protein
MLNIQIGVSCEQLKDGREWGIDNWLRRCSGECLRVDLQMSGRDALRVGREPRLPCLGKLILPHGIIDWDIFGSVPHHLKVNDKPSTEPTSNHYTYGYPNSR